MRMAVGFVSLLVTIGVLVWVFSEVAIPTAKTGKEAQDDVRALTTRSIDGQRDEDSVTLQPHPDAARPTGMLVTDVTPGGAMEHFYGLKKGDILTAIDQQGYEEQVRDLRTVEEVKARLADAVQRSKRLTVTRNGQRVTLAVGARPAGAGNGTGGATPAQGSRDGKADNAEPAPARNPRDAAQGIKDLLEQGTPGTE